MFDGSQGCLRIERIERINTDRLDAQWRPSPIVENCFAKGRATARYYPFDPQNPDASCRTFVMDADSAAVMRILAAQKGSGGSPKPRETRLTS